MKRFSQIIIGISALCMGLLPFSLQAQQDLVLHNMFPVPQRVMNNPAFIPDSRVHHSVPVLSSMNINLRSPLALSDVLTVRDDDSLVIDLEHIAERLWQGNFASLEFHKELLFFGFKTGALYFNAGSNLVESFHFRLPPDLMTFLVKGNGAFLNETADLGGLYLNTNVYLENFVGFNMAITEELTAGLRAKYLLGLMSIRTRETKLDLYTDPVDYSLRANAMIGIDMAIPYAFDTTSGGFPDSTSSFGDIMKDIFRNHLNGGYAFDFGVRYQLNDHWAFDASLLDIGRMRWTKDARNYVSDETSFEFAGIDLFEVFQDSTMEVEDQFQEILDSLENSFNFQETSEGFSNNLVPKVFLGATYQVNPGLALHGLVRADLFNGRPYQSLTLSATKRLTNAITVSMSYTARQRSYASLGAGLSVNLGAFQFFILTDTGSNFLYMHDTRSMHFHAGCNLTYGRKKEKDLPADAIVSSVF